MESDSDHVDATVDKRLMLVVTDKAMVTSTVCRFELRRPDGTPLPEFKVGGHIRVMTPSGTIRQYSLNNDEADADRYVIAVKREDGGRGGSLSMHRDLALGDTIEVSRPISNHVLGLAPGYILIAGGIGITPIVSMFRKLKRLKADGVTLIYCTRNPEDAAYGEELMQSGEDVRVVLYHSALHAGRRFDFWPYLKGPDGRHLHYCGPEAMMNEIHAMSIHWPRSAVHFENFAGMGATGGNKPFRLRAASTGGVFEIPADKTVLEVLREAGHKPKSSCESGTCGTCRVRLIDGVPDHRDLVLAEAEKADSFMPCVSRAFGGELVLDI
jgi:phthalate 4,5-dioxygenase reductase subunit